MTDDAGMTPVVAAPGYSGRALGTVCVAVVAATAGLAMPPLGIVLGITVVALALSCRRELRERPELRGWGLSLGATIIGVVVLVVTLFSTDVPVVLTSFLQLSRV